MFKLQQNTAFLFKEYHLFYITKRREYIIQHIHGHRLGVKPSNKNHL